MSDMAQILDEIKLLISKANNIVVFCGAGISVASGLPAFRSKTNGIHKKKINGAKTVIGKDLFYESMMNIPSTRDIFLQSHARFFQDCMRAKPSHSHYFLQKLNQQNKIAKIFNQNIDGLFEKLELESTKIVNIHGTYGDMFKCTSGHHQRRDKNETFKAMLDLDYSQLVCGRKLTKRLGLCRGVLYPDILYFDSSPTEEMYENLKSLSATTIDLIFIMGTSLAIKPFRNAINYLQKENQNAKTIVLNHDLTNYEDLKIDLISHEDCDIICKNLLLSIK